MTIGYSWGDPESRFQVIQVHSPVPVERHGVLVGDEALEFELHCRFDDDRDHGEWFRPSPELDAFIAEHAREWTAEVGKTLRREDKRPPRLVDIIPSLAQLTTRRMAEHEMQEQYRRIEEHQSGCHMAGLDPDKTPMKDKKDKPAKGPTKRLRYGPLQAILDKLAAEKGVENCRES